MAYLYSFEHSVFPIGVSCQFDMLILEMKYKTLGKISTEAVEKATGKSWDEWIEIIDKEGGEKLTHKEIARLLYDKKYIENGWWCQQVTVGYEYAKGRRKVGETLTQGYEIGVQKMLPVNKEKLWKFLNSKRGKEIWSKDIEYEMRTVKDGERLRMKWKRPEWKSYSTLQITLFCPRNTEEKTNINFHQERLPSLKARSQMRDHWKKKLEEIAKAL